MNTPIRQAVRAALFSGAVIVAGSYSAPSVAADSANQARSLGQINVVGTRIKRTAAETAQPVVRIDRTQIENMGVSSVGQLLQRLSSAGQADNQLVNYSGNFIYGGSGNVGIDLRYLGAKRTLVLVNGERWLSGLSGATDLSVIPTSIIDHIEVLRDGASAIYGSDAISGVINIVTRKSFNGAEASAYYGMYMRDGHHDGQTTKFYYTMGANNNNAGIYFNVGYRQNEPIDAEDRDISSEPYPGTGLTRGSSANPQGYIQLIPPAGSPLAANSTACPVTQFAHYSAPVCKLTAKRGTNGADVGDFKAFGYQDRYNYAAGNFVLTPQEMTSLYLHGHYDFSPQLTFNSEVLYARRYSEQQAAPPSGGIDVNAPRIIPADYIYNPFGFTLSTVKPVPLGYTYTSGPKEGEEVFAPNLLDHRRRQVEFGLRRYNIERQVFTYRGGFQGNFLLGNTFWNWDATYTYGHSAWHTVHYGAINSRLIKESFSPECGTYLPNCVPFNWFGGQGADGTGTITQEMVDYASYVRKDAHQNYLRSYSANLSSGNIAQLPGGPLGVALGYAYHEHDGGFIPDSITQADPITPSKPTSGRTSNTAFYGELNIPIVSHVPGAYLLSVDIADRQSDFSSFGTANTGRIGLKWQPYEDLLIRGTWSQGFRAPNIEELFGGRQDVLETMTDPCSDYLGTGVSGDVIARCKAAGVPSSYVQIEPYINYNGGSNPNLQPESSTSRSFGFVYSPSFLPGFNVNFDYYKIELTDTIQSIGGQAFLDFCYVGGVQGYCDRITRDAAGNITKMINLKTNIGGTTTDGYDYGVNYSFLTDVGAFKISLSGTHINQFKTFLPVPGGGTQTKSYVGHEYGGIVFPHGIPANKANLAVSWARGNWEANYWMYYIGDMIEKCSDYLDGSPNSFTNMGLCTNPNFENNTLSTTHIGAVVYHNVQLGYTFTGIDSTVVFGVHNITDKRPPPSLLAAINGFDPALYGSLVGVFPYLRVTTRF